MKGKASTEHNIRGLEKWLAHLKEDLGSGPSIHMVTQFSNTCNSSSRESNSFFFNNKEFFLTSG